MTQPEKPKIEDLTEELAFWNTFREIQRTKKWDMVRIFPEWAAELERELHSPGAREDFRELCKAGCSHNGLAALLMLLRHSPSLEGYWAKIVGHPNNRHKATHALEKAAQTLEGLYADALAAGSTEKEEFTKIGRVPVSQIISELRMHTRLINFGKELGADTGTRSPTQFAKYFLAAYVRRMTGDFRDRGVSGLVAEILDLDGYNEVAQRMWRSRNCARMEKHYSWMVKFFVAMDVVIEHSA
jgi:hypothetical protein